MKVLVIGGTGFIGGAIAVQAKTAGHDIVLFNRGLSDTCSAYETIQGDVKDLPAFKQQLLDVKPDVVVHTVAYTEQHGWDLVTVFEGTKTHLIVLGSGDCYQAFWGLNNKEDASCFPIREDAELCRERHYWKAHPWHRGGAEYDKNLLTDVVMNSFKQKKTTPTVFRVSMVYGPRDPQYRNRHGGIIKRLIDGKKDMVMGATEQGIIFTYGYIDNIAAAVVHSFGLPKTFGEVYNLGEENVRTRWHWADLYAEVAGVKLAHHVLPWEILSSEEALNDPSRNFIMDVSKFTKDTGFKDPVGLKEAVKKTYEWAVLHPEALKGVTIDYEREAALVKTYREFVTEVNAKMNPAVKVAEA